MSTNEGQVGPDREQLRDREPSDYTANADEKMLEREFVAKVEHDLRNATIGEFQIFRQVRAEMRKERES